MLRTWVADSEVCFISSNCVRRMYVLFLLQKQYSTINRCWTLLLKLWQQILRW